MKFEKAPPYIVETFEAALASTMGERRNMFSYPAGFANGHMFCGVFARQIFVRLAEDDRVLLLKRAGAHLFDPMGGRPMREYVVAPDDLLEDAAELRDWFAKAFAFAQSLPPKDAKPKKAAKPKVAGDKAKAAAKPRAAKSAQPVKKTAR